MTGRFFPILVSVFIVVCSQAEPATEFVEASDGGTAVLPCVLTPTINPDKMIVVLWYRGIEESPIYKYDLRGSHPQHWADPSLNNRFFLRILDDNRATMTISPTRITDQQIFHCRVDYQKSATRITHVNLTITVPPISVQVSDDWGPVRNGLTTSYPEGASIKLTCVATAGRPLAKVSWWRDGQLLTNETEYLIDPRRSQSVLKIDKLNRSYLLAVYNCEASNSKLQPPLIVRVAIDMFLRPLEVELLGENTELSAGRTYNITCKSTGSRPPANITWWKDGKNLEASSVTVSPDGNATTSILTFSPVSSDHSLVLACKAANPRIPFSDKQSAWILKVSYPPTVTLTLGHGLNANDIKEGADVYFECHLIANPWVHRVWWLRNGERLISNGTAGVIVSNQTLVLQGVNRWSAGQYACEATNTEGTSTSPPFHLKVKFEPVCGDGVARRVLGAAKDEPLKIECRVDAEPAAAKFRWSFNSTPGISRDLTEFASSPEAADSSGIAAGGSSILTYIPRIPADYGTLQCSAENEIGVQIIPCTFHILPAQKPDPPHGCQILNVTLHTAQLTCKKGFDGGLRQKFALILNSGENVITNVTNSSPEFNISNLEPLQEYSATVYALNAKGSSKIVKPVVIRTLPTPGLKEQRRFTEPSNVEVPKASTGPWLYIVLAAASTLIVAAAVGGIVFAVKRFRVDSPIRAPRIRSPKIQESPITPHVVTPRYTDTISDDNNPDLILDAPNSELVFNNHPIPPYTITPRPASKRNCATQMPVKPYHVTWAPMLQSRNCATQTPPPHKESSV